MDEKEENRTNKAIFFFFLMLLTMNEAVPGIAVGAWYAVVEKL